MRRIFLLIGALLGGLTSLPLIALSYLGQQLAGLPFVPFDVFDHRYRGKGLRRKWPGTRWGDRLGGRPGHPEGTSTSR
jgi:hypothetical protein